MEKNNVPLSAKHPYEMLKNEGYSKSLVEKFLPDWWDDSLLKTSAGVFQFANILQQKLGLSVNFSPSGEFLVTSNNEQCRFKRRRDTDISELSMSANLGRALGRVAIHCAKNPYTPLPSSASELRASALELSDKGYVNFDSLLRFCWQSGIPVLFLDFLPTKAKRMAGMVTRIDDRPVILLGYKNEQHAKQLFVLAHELGHLQRGHIKSNETLIDDDLESITEKISGDGKNRQDAEEREADEFALKLIRGDLKTVTDNLGRPTSPAVLVANAIKISKSIHVDPGHIILSFAYQSNDWITANKALAFIPNVNDALALLKSQFLANADLEKLSAENRSHLLAMQSIVNGG